MLQVHTTFHTTHKRSLDRFFFSTPPPHLLRTNAVLSKAFKKDDKTKNMF